MSLSCMLSCNSQMFLYLDGLNSCIEHLDIFCNIWNLILWKEAVNKQSSCYDGYEYGEFILGKLEQKLKIQSYFLVFDTVIGVVHWYDDTESKAPKCICELFGNIWLLY